MIRDKKQMGNMKKLNKYEQQLYGKLSETKLVKRTLFMYEVDASKLLKCSFLVGFAKPGTAVKTRFSVLERRPTGFRFRFRFLDKQLICLYYFFFQALTTTGCLVWLGVVDADSTVQ